MVEGRLEIKGLYENCQMIFKQFLVQYDTKVSFKKLSPIESLDEKEKSTRWENAGVITQDREERLKVVKVEYLIDYLIEKYYEKSN